MTSTQKRLVALNIAGGVAVLGSYAAGFAYYPDDVGGLWGGVSEQWRGLYTTAMFPAALGYFPMTYFLLFRANLDQKVFGGVSAGACITLLYAVALSLAAAWMPLTLEFLTGAGAGLWPAIHLALLFTGVASLGLVGCVIALRPTHGGGVAWTLALLGSLFFTFQTGVLDALVWPALFPLP